VVGLIVDFFPNILEYYDLGDVAPIKLNPA
jgi:hypothetical protein